MCEAGTEPSELAEPGPDPAEDQRNLPRARRQVLELLSASPVMVDDIVRRCQFSASAVTVVLLELELAGRLERLPGSRVALLTDKAASQNE